MKKEILNLAVIPTGNFNKEFWKKISSICEKYQSLSPSSKEKFLHRMDDLFQEFSQEFADEMESPIAVKNWFNNFKTALIEVYGGVQ